MVIIWLESFKYYAFCDRYLSTRLSCIDQLDERSVFVQSRKLCKRTLIDIRKLLLAGKASSDDLQYAEAFQISI